MANRRTGWILAAFSLAILILVPTGAASADEPGFDLDLRAGVYSDASEAFVGAGFLARLGQSNWFANPNFEYVFVDRGDLATLNADFHYDIAQSGEADFWLGAGAAFILTENGRGSDETDFGANLLAGVGFLRTEPVRPYIQFKVVLSDDTEAVLAVGLRFF